MTNPPISFTGKGTMIEQLDTIYENTLKEKQLFPPKYTENAQQKRNGATEEHLQLHPLWLLGKSTVPHDRQY